MTLFQRSVTTLGSGRTVPGTLGYGNVSSNDSEAGNVIRGGAANGALAADGCSDVVAEIDLRPAGSFVILPTSQAIRVSFIGDEYQRRFYFGQVS